MNDESKIYISQERRVTDWSQGSGSSQRRPEQSGFMDGADSTNTAMGRKVREMQESANAEETEGSGIVNGGDGSQSSNKDITCRQGGSGAVNNGDMSQSKHPYGEEARRVRDGE